MLKSCLELYWYVIIESYNSMLIRAVGFASFEVLVGFERSVCSLTCSRKIGFTRI